MSRTSQVDSVANPINIYIRFNGDEEKGYFSFWDGTKEVTVDSLEFILMDMRASIGGYSDKKEARIFSNLVKSSQDQLVIRCNKETIFKGDYKSNKDKIQALGGKFQQNLFCLVNLDGELKAANVQLSGSTLMSWMDFTQNNSMKNIYASKIVASRGELKTKGRVKYYSIDFTTTPLDSADAALADEYTDGVLTPWLESVDSRNAALQEVV